ncbi:hypothetical protein B0H19DRAFT_1055628 [Mycena capillaripes]|nr:hypothetical protein B0H19DRAFT_1055628 [Mycena capillaripes]
MDSLPQGISLSRAHLQALKPQVAGALLRPPKFSSLWDDQSTAAGNAHILHTRPPESAKPTLCPISRTQSRSLGRPHRQNSASPNIPLVKTTAATRAHIIRVPPPDADKLSSRSSSQTNMKNGAAGAQP